MKPIDRDIRREGRRWSHDEFDKRLDHLVTLGKVNKSGVRVTTPVRLKSAVYDAATNSVKLITRAKLPNKPLQLSLNAAAIVDARGQPLDGNRDGQPGGNFQASFTKAGLNLASASTP